MAEPSLADPRLTQRLRLWCDRDGTTAFHMERDARLLEGAEADADWTPLMRLYRFRPAGITLGRAQDPARTLDLDRCAADGIGWSVRPTGGRAILHDAEWTYSFTARHADPEWGGALGAAYDRIAKLIVTSLIHLGVPAEVAGERRAGAGRGGPCFATTTRHEIVLAGRKLVGSAQRRTASAWIQQGSLLLGPGHLRLAEYLRLDAGARAEARRSLEFHSTDARAYLGADPPLERWAAALGSVLPGARPIHDLPRVG